jgi:hypothetical protein
MILPNFKTSLDIPGNEMTTEEISTRFRLNIKNPDEFSAKKSC